MRGRQLSTVVAMIVGMVERGEVQFEPQWIAGDRLERIEEVCANLGLERLRPLKDALPPEVTFEEIKLVVAYLRWQQSGDPDAELSAP